MLLGIKYEELVTEFQKTLRALFPEAGINFKSRTYPTLSVLDHKGSIYIRTRKDSEFVSFHYDGYDYQIDGFRANPHGFAELTNTGTPLLGGNENVVSENLPKVVLNFLLDYRRIPGFIEQDLYSIESR